MRKIASLLTVLLFSTVFVFAQSQVKGKVTDSQDGSPLASISIKVKGTDIGTSTAADGSFSIDIGKNSATLEISGVGYLTRDLKATAGKTVSVSLYKETKNLSEVVVTALGIKREKRSLGYATQTVGAEELNKSGTGNPLSELSGKVSGLTIINSTGDPGGGTFMLLRGVTSTTGNNQPLMVVDGVPIDNSVNNYDPTNNGFQAGGANADLLAGAQPTNRGVDLNPDDIESITVLKGPAAAALYGIQASSGALIITTKKGKAGKHGAVVSFNSSVSFNRVTQLPGLQDTYSQGDGGIYQGPETGSSLSWGAAIDTLAWNGATDYEYDKHGQIVGKSDPSAKIPVTPYDRYAFFKTGNTYDNNVAFSGSTENGSYRMSYGNVYQTGTIPLTNYVKNNFSITGQSNLTDKLKVSGAVNYITSTNSKTQQGSNLSGIMLGLTRTPATFDDANGVTNPSDPASYLIPSDGSQRNYRGGGGYDNPYWTINKEPFTSDLNRAFGYGQISYQALNWLSLQYRVGGDEYTQSDKNSYDINSRAFPAGAIYLINYINTQFNSDFIITAKKNFSKDFTGSLILGQNLFLQNSSNSLIAGSGLALPNFLDISNASSIQSSESLVKYRTAAFYADADLVYKNQFYLTLTARREQSSTLPADNDVFYYPSASFGWVFTEMKGLKNSNVLSFGKLRLAATEVGKDAPPQSLTTPYKSTTFLDGFTQGITFPVNGVPGYQLSSAITTVGNPDLMPLSIKSYEGGVDLSFFHNRMSFSGTYYYSKTTNDIFSVAVPYSSGFAAKELNAATLSNNGVELSLNTTPVRTEYGLQWDLNFNWSHNESDVVDLYPGVNRFLVNGFGGGEAEIDAIKGKPYGQIYGDVTPHAVLTDLKSPLLISDDPNSPGYAQPVAGGQGPQQDIGDINPKWIGSAISNLTYKSLSLAIQVDVRHGGDIWNGTRGALANKGTAIETANRGTATTFKGLLGHLDANGNVVHYGPNGTELPGAGAANTIASSYDEFYWQNIGNSFGAGQETDVENGGYTKIRQVSLTYQLPKSFINKAKINGLSLTIFANNIYTWTKYDGVDPETSLTGPSNGQGLDYFNNPGIKSYGIRLNVGL